ncbi:hypothetical protein IAQ61_009311 [Plenodomus lingam]|uniref:uncharacterized protein n=1 Tax=Leptosphaeria maculans TaxID=5022 RepID=UPI00331834EB|nr:hypothetical protein IAQ61_009311 [Plenodomus lingam]
MVAQQGGGSIALQSMQKQGRRILEVTQEVGKAKKKLGNRYAVWVGLCLVEYRDIVGGMDPLSGSPGNEAESAGSWGLWEEVEVFMSISRQRLARAWMHVTLWG